jgi:uridine kinase
MNKDILPPKRTVSDMKTKVYIHAQIDPSIVRRLKHEASNRGYKMGEFLELLLDSALPKER